MECGKIIYTDKAAAHRALSDIARRTRTKNGRVYHCTDCDGWHVSSSPYKTKRAK